MGIRELVAGTRLSAGMRALNARHPWSHNDHFHPWILSRLPDHRAKALDVGCGQGELLAALAVRFDLAHGVDIDPAMRSASAARCAGRANVIVDDTELHDLPGPYDCITMISALHHLDVERALHDVRTLLTPGGRFLCVGLAPPVTPVDHLWDLASMATNPLIGYVKHPWVSTEPATADPFPTKPPTLALEDLRAVTEGVLPGARLRRHLGFRHTIEWTAPRTLAG